MYSLTHSLTRMHHCYIHSLTLTRYDVILDCTDNVATRYLLNDACVLLHKPLVSGSALRFEGQLTVYGYEGGPCYRCLFPSPPDPTTVTNCSEGGVLGAGEDMCGLCVYIHNLLIRSFHVSLIILVLNIKHVFIIPSPPSSVPGVIGTMQATEVLKLLTKTGSE